jgi:hypothetical protein
VPWGVHLKPLSAFAQFAEPMTAVLADQRELTSSPSAFAAFQLGHFLSAFAVFNRSYVNAPRLARQGHRIKWGIVELGHPLSTIC